MKTEQVKLEIRAAEGGEDAKLLVNDMANIYKKVATINNFTYSVEH
jgi:protein subunit release factor A